nr:DUF6446 family protein [Pararhodobacter sp. SW119]
MYYFQVWGLYDPLPPTDRLTVATPDGPADLAVTDFRGIDSDSSPLRRRACFRLHAAEGLIEHPAPEPLNAPRWFDCFDAAAIGGDLAQGRATAYLVEGDFAWGFDRVMAVYPDGAAYLWNQMNTCGRAHFDGRDLPPGCPPAPES